MEVKGKVINVSFSNEKIRNLFLTLCDQAPKVIVDWPRFRELDKLGIFSVFKDQELSCRWRDASLRRSGMCYYCGVKPSIPTKEGFVGGLCQECGDKLRQRQRIKAKERRQNAKGE